jgi:hypothetical protein
MKVKKSYYQTTKERMEIYGKKENLKEQIKKLVKRR